MFKKGEAMNKDKLRFLAIGFLLAALILAGFQLFGSPFVAESHQNEYKEKYESISTEYKRLEQENKMIESKKETPSFSLSAESNDSTESTSGKSESIIFIIKEGEPSSVVLDNLVKEKLIDNYEQAQTYLIDRQQLTSIQYGSYNLSKDMGFEKILDIITAQ